MTAKIRIAHEILFIIIILFILISLRVLGTDTFNARDIDGIERISAYKRTWEADSSLYCGGKDVVEFSLTKEELVDTDLSFFASHQDTEVFIDGELIYSQKRKSQNIYGKTPGKYWATVRLDEDDFGKLIRLEFTPSYKNRIGKIPKLYLGESSKIIIERFRSSIFTIIVSLSTLLMGLFFLIWTLCLCYLITPLLFLSCLFCA